MHAHMPPGYECLYWLARSWFADRVMVAIGRGHCSRFVGADRAQSLDVSRAAGLLCHALVRAIGAADSAQNA